MDNRLRNFLGKPIYFNEFPIYSPTINEICEIGEIQYNIYLAASTFNVEAIFKHVLGLDDEIFEKLSDMNEYDLFISFDLTRELLIEAFSFFTKEKVKYDDLFSIFKIDEKVFVSKHNYESIAKIIKEQNGITEEDDVKKQKFLNEKARQLYLKRKKLREQLRKKNSDNTLSLKDMLSVLCNAEGNGINVFNVGQLTIYQVYEHFERLNIKENHMRVLRIWANGYLKEGQNLPEWIVNGKL